MPRGQLASVSEVSFNAARPASLLTEFTYDPLGRLTVRDVQAVAA